MTQNEQLSWINTLDPNGKALDVASIVGSKTFFTGADDLNMDLDVQVNGYAYIYWTRLPSWFEYDKDLKFFKQYTEKNLIALNGISNVELQTGSVTSGFNGKEIPVPTGINPSQLNEFTLTHKEYTGSITRKLYEKWISYIRDPETGLRAYPKIFDIPGCLKNDTGSLLYIVTSPDANNASHAEQLVQYACWWNGVFPTTIALSHYNYSQNQNVVDPLDIEMKGVAKRGIDVDAYAANVLRDKILGTADSKSHIELVTAFDSKRSNPEYKGLTLEDLIKNTMNEK